MSYMSAQYPFPVHIFFDQDTKPVSSFVISRYRSVHLCSVCLLTFLIQQGREPQSLVSSPQFCLRSCSSEFCVSPLQAANLEHQSPTDRLGWAGTGSAQNSGLAFRTGTQPTATTQGVGRRNQEKKIKTISPPTFSVESKTPQGDSMLALRTPRSGDSSPHLQSMGVGL